MRLKFSVRQIRLYLNEEEDPPSDTGSVPRTGDQTIVDCIVRAGLEALRTDPQSLMMDRRPEDIEALGQPDGSPDLEAEMPFALEFVPAIEKQALALINLRDQPGYRPEVLRLLENLSELSKGS